jgi:hypothetical protein
MGDDDGGVPAVDRPRQLGREPAATRQGVLADGHGVIWPAIPCRLHELHEVAGRAHGLVTTRFAEQVEVAPPRRAHEAQPLAGAISADDRLAFQHA